MNALTSIRHGEFRPAAEMIRLLHVFPSFGAGGVELRTATIINCLGPEFSHTIVPIDANRAAASQIDSCRAVDFVAAPQGAGTLLYPQKMCALVKRIRPDLVLTYNWGAIDATLGARAAAICPVLHAEDGFGSDEANGLKRRRVVARRLLLNHIYATVVPSKTLLEIGLKKYRVRPDKLRLISNGVDLGRFTPGRNEIQRRRFKVSASDLLFGYVGGLRAEKNLTLLIRAFAKARITGARLMLVGDGATRTVLESEAQACGVADRVIFTGSVTDPFTYYQAFDVFVMSSATEQMPLALLEAMACGLPAVCTRVGDIELLLGTSTGTAVLPPGDLSTYAAALCDAAHNAGWRASAGAANRARCVERYSLQSMLHKYEGLYRAAARRGTNNTNRIASVL